MRIVDLTHPFDDGMPVFPGLPEPSFRAQVVLALRKLRDSGGAPARMLGFVPD